MVSGIPSCGGCIPNCGSDDDNKGSSPGYTYNDIKGSWKWTSSYDRKGDNIQEDFFVDQHLYIISATDFESTTKEVGDVTYVLNGDKFVKKNTNNRTMTATIKISGNTMTMVGTTNDGWTFNYVLQHEISVK